MEEIDANISLHEHAICSLKIRRNAASALCRLPVELLCEVLRLCRCFEYVHHSGGQRWHWFHVSQTCHRVRFAALSCSSLWTDINFHLSPEWSREMLKRSKDAPLCISARFYRATPETRQVMLDALANSSRIENLTLSGDATDVAAAVKMLIEPTPHLRSLDISTTDKDSSVHLTLPSGLLGSHSPQLQHIRLFQCAMLWDMPVKNLTSLFLGYECATVAQITNLLRHTPLLESLVLLHVLGDIDTPPSRSSCPIILSKLNKLSLTSSTEPPNAFVHLLFSITVPSSILITLHMQASSYPIFDFGPLLAALNSCTNSPSPFLHLPTTWQFSTQDTHRLPVSQTLDIHGWIQGPPDPLLASVSLSLDYDSPGHGNVVTFRETLLAVTEALSMHQIQDLRFSGKCLIIDKLDLFSERCTHVSSLSLGGVYSTLISSLRPKEDETKQGIAAKMIFPQLRTLSIVGGDMKSRSCSALRKVLKYRDSHNARLEKLVLEDSAYLHVDAVCDLEDSVDWVEWDGIEYDPNEVNEPGYDRRMYYRSVGLELEY